MDKYIILTTLCNKEKISYIEIKNANIEFLNWIDKNVK